MDAAIVSLGTAFDISGQCGTSSAPAHYALTWGEVGVDAAIVSLGPESDISGQVETSSTPAYVAFEWRGVFVDAAIFSQGPTPTLVVRVGPLQQRPLTLARGRGG